MQAEPYRQSVEDYLARTVMPDLGEHLVTSRMLTPHEFQMEYKSLKGAAFSVEPILQQSAWFRPHNESEDIDHLYFAGAGTHPGVGMRRWGDQYASTFSVSSFSEAEKEDKAHWLSRTPQ